MRLQRFIPWALTLFKMGFVSGCESRAKHNGGRRFPALGVRTCRFVNRRDIWKMKPKITFAYFDEMEGGVSGSCNWKILDTVFEPFLRTFTTFMGAAIILQNNRKQPGENSPLKAYLALACVQGCCALPASPCVNCD
jgi:hypothetical protein